MSGDKLVEKLEEARRKGFCPVCGYSTQEKDDTENPGGSYNICPVCYWEDEGLGIQDPDFSGGANRVSIKEAIKNYEDIGANEPGAVEHTKTPEEVEQEHNIKLERHPDWPLNLEEYED